MSIANCNYFKLFYLAISYRNWSKCARLCKIFKVYLFL